MAKIKIRTGNIGSFKKGIFSKFKILYSGMPTSQTFAISPIIDESFLAEGFKFAPMIYYSIESEEIEVLEHKFKVKEVDANYIVLRLIKRL